ncbi:hypothetical protein QFZ28_000751 [Neobacillus niacini]|nr:hypothetical protein [Neobacillus niacini]MDQ1000351.1 hypothetical protein [Neobacillus niacini]
MYEMADYEFIKKVISGGNTFRHLLSNTPGTEIRILALTLYII